MSLNFRSNCTVVLFSFYVIIFYISVSSLLCLAYFVCTLLPCTRLSAAMIMTISVLLLKMQSSVEYRISRFGSPGVSTWFRRASGGYSVGDGCDSQRSTERTDPRHRRSAAHQRRRHVSTTADGGAESIPTKIHHGIRQTSFPRIPCTLTADLCLSVSLDRVRAVPASRVGPGQM